MYNGGNDGGDGYPWGAGRGEKWHTSLESKENVLR